jgi:hypothetical protein
MVGQVVEVVLAVALVITVALAFQDKDMLAKLETEKIVYGVLVEVLARQPPEVCPQQLVVLDSFLVSTEHLLIEVAEGEAAPPPHSVFPVKPAVEEGQMIVLEMVL